MGTTTEDLHYTTETKWWVVIHELGAGHFSPAPSHAAALADANGLAARYPGATVRVLHVTDTITVPAPTTEGA